MKAQSLKKEVLTCIDSSSPLDLTELAKNSSALYGLLDCLPIEGLISLTSLAVETSSKQSWFAFSGSLRGMGSLNLRVTIEAGRQKGKDLIRFRAAFAKTAKFPLPKIRGFKIEDTYFAVDTIADSAPVGKFGFTIYAGSFILPLSIPLPFPDRDWTWTGDFDPISIPKFSELATLAGQKDILKIIPPGALDIDGLVLRDFAISINPGQFKLSQLLISLQLDRWELVKNKAVLEDIDFVFDLKNPTDKDQRSLSGHLTGQLQIGSKRIPLNGLMREGLELEGYINQLKLSVLLEQYLPSLKGKLPDITLNNATVFLATPARLNFSTQVSANLKNLTKNFTLPLPEALHSLDISKLAFGIDAAQGTGNIDLQTDKAIQLIKSDWGKLTLHYLDLRIAKAASKPIGFDCEFKLDGHFALGTTCKLTLKELVFNKQRSAQKWSIQGEATLELAGNVYTLKVDILRTAKGYRIAFIYETKIQLSDFNGLGAATLQNVKLFVAKNTGADTKSSAWTVGIEGDVNLQVNNVFKAQGSLHVEQTPQGPQLAIVAKPPALPALSLPVEGIQAPQVKVGLEPIRLELKPGDDTKNTFETELQAGANAAFKSVPNALQRWFPSDPLQGSLIVDPQGSRISLVVPESLQPDIPELALSFASGYRLSLGKPSVFIESIDIMLGKKPSLRQRMRIGIPKELNKIFGVNKQGKAINTVFKDQCTIELSINKSVAINIIDPPFKDLEFYQKHGKSWTDWDFGDCGKVSFQVPEFALAAGRWQASFGFERLTELKLPLAPLKFLLGKAGLPPVSLKAIPDTIPLQSIDLSQPDLYDELLKLLGKDFLEKLPKAIQTGLIELVKGLKTSMERAPTRLLEYLQSSVPAGGIIDIEAAATGMKVGIRVPGSEPLKLLWPTMLPMPALTGLTIKGFSLAPRSGGSLLEIGFDGYIDSFDLPSLAIGLSLDKAKDLSQRFVLNEFLAYMPTATPIPIPVFYKELALEYRNVLGLELQSHWKFPQPELSLTDHIQTLGSMHRFLTVREVLMHQAGLPDPLKLDFTIGKNFITLPEYLGGKTLGQRIALPKIDIVQCLALFLDSVKTGNPRYLIEAIPLKIKSGADTQWIRVGQTQVKLGPFGIKVGWCVTTDTEFVKEVLPAIRKHEIKQLSVEKEILSIVPAKAGAPALDRGFVILLAGEFAVAKAASLQAQFGMVLSASTGFGVGVKLRGTLANFLTLEIGGVIQATPEKLLIAGGVTLKGRRRTWIEAKGQILVSNQHLAVDVLLNVSNSLGIRGQFVIGRSGVSLAGNVTWQLTKKKSISATARVAFSSNGFSFQFAMKLFKLQFAVGVQVNAQGITAFAALKLPPQLQGGLTSAMKQLAKQHSATEVGKHYAQMMSDFKALGDVKVSIEGMREDLPGLCKAIIKMIYSTIDSQVNAVLDKAWEKPFRKTGKKIAYGYAKPYVNRLNNVAKVAARPNSAHYRRDLKKALNALVINNHLVIRVGIPKTKINFVAYRRNIMNRKQLNLLKQGIASIDNLPDISKRSVSNKAIFGKLPKEKQIMAQTCYEIEKGMSGVFPSIESIGFATKLGALDSSAVALKVVIVHKRKRKTLQVKADLSSTKGIATSIAKAFLKNK